jgi:hypothetical protein
VHAVFYSFRAGLGKPRAARGIFVINYSLPYTMGFTRARYDQGGAILVRRAGLDGILFHGGTGAKSTRPARIPPAQADNRPSRRRA